MIKARTSNWNVYYDLMALTGSEKKKLRQ